MSASQPAILSPVPAHARHPTFIVWAGADVKPVLVDLAAVLREDGVVTGFGPGLIQVLGARVDGLRPLPAISGLSIEIPST
jgi:porphyrinogen peroxidase